MKGISKTMRKGCSRVTAVQEAWKTRKPDYLKEGGWRMALEGLPVKTEPLYLTQFVGAFGEKSNGHF